MLLKVDDTKDKKGKANGKAKAGCCGPKEDVPPPPPEVPLSRLLGMAPDSYWMMILGAICSL
jgi:hypothetical protein